MTKEEILKNSGCYMTDLISSSTHDAILTAMDTYAQQKAMEFWMWNFLNPDASKNISYYNINERVNKLYQLFLKDQ